jgi:hypothetical protein
MKNKLASSLSSQLPGDGVDSAAFGVSADGSAVVGYGRGVLGTEAFLWTTDGGMKRLWDVLLANGVDPAADAWAGPHGCQRQ